MQSETEVILDWASRKLGVRFRDPGERRQQAFAQLNDTGFAPDPTTTIAISILLHYEPGEPLAAPFLTPADLREIERERLRESVIARLQELPDMPVDQRIGAYHQFRQEADGDPWLQHRVYRAAGLIVGGIGNIEPDDPLRLLVLLPTEAVLKRPSPPPPPDPFEFLQFEDIRANPIKKRGFISPGRFVLIFVAVFALRLFIEMLMNEYYSTKSNSGNVHPRNTRHSYKGIKFP